MANAYIRYTVNSKRVGSQWDNTRIIVDRFNHLKTLQTLEGCDDTYLTCRKPGDVVIVELFKRSKKKPRIPRDILIFVIQ